MTTPILVLFDIDGTLVRTLEAGIRSMNRAFADQHARGDALDTVAIAGRPDLGITMDAFRAIGVDPTPERIEALRDGYFAHLRHELAQTSGADFGVLPGVEAMLDALDARQDVTVGLLTGNFEGGAEIKLRHFEIWHRFALGAFGDRHVLRRDLVPLAVARAREIGIDADPARTVIIGDTPLDIDCAHAHGALALAVATGSYTPAELATAEADAVVETLEACDTAGVWLDRLLERRAG